MGHVVVPSVLLHSQKMRSTDRRSAELISKVQDMSRDSTQSRGATPKLADLGTPKIACAG